MPNKMNRSTENKRFRFGAEGEAGNVQHCRWSLTPSRNETSRLNAESFCWVLFESNAAVYTFNKTIRFRLQR